jgi:hypothetical protein
MHLQHGMHSYLPTRSLLLVAVQTNNDNKAMSVTMQQQ